MVSRPGWGGGGGAGRIEPPRLRETPTESTEGRRGALTVRGSHSTFTRLVFAGRFSEDGRTPDISPRADEHLLPAV